MMGSYGCDCTPGLTAKVSLGVFAAKQLSYDRLLKHSKGRAMLLIVRTMHMCCDLLCPYQGVVCLASGPSGVPAVAVIATQGEGCNAYMQFASAHQHMQFAFAHHSPSCTEHS
jgi:hypothetical protein